jgi:hypothetical protein
MEKVIFITLAKSIWQLDSLKKVICKGEHTSTELATIIKVNSLMEVQMDKGCIQRLTILTRLTKL